LFNKVLLQSLYSETNEIDDEYDIPSQANNGVGLKSRNYYPSDHLSFPDNQNGGKWKKITVPMELQTIGIKRLDLVLIRHLQFFTMLQHVLLYKLGKELEEHDGYVIKSYSTIDPTVTEFRGQQMWNKNSYKMSPYDRTSKFHPYKQ
jgi:hypothetical protein